MTPEFAPASDATLPLWMVWTGDPLPQDAGDWPQACGFTAKAGQLCLLPDASGGLRGAIMGLGERAQAGRDRFHLARAHALPKGDWHLAGIPQGLDPDQLALGWLLGQYRFTRYKGAPVQGPRLVCPEGVDADRLLAIAAGEFLTRDLINTPASDLGPDKLNQKAKAVVLLMRLDPAKVKITPGREDWNVDGIFAYSKVCTHVGCPIALYEQHTHHLLCPCHQSTFDLTQECKVIFGPASHALPQLPITVDDEGFLVAQSDFHEPVGPVYWERG